MRHKFVLLYPLQILLSVYTIKEAVNIIATILLAHFTVPAKEDTSFTPIDVLVKVISFECLYCINYITVYLKPRCYHLFKSKRL